MILKNWTEIKEEFLNSDLFLGNGFSICFSDSFKYSNILDLFYTKCSKKTKDLFECYSTYNFEIALKNIDISIATMKLMSFDTVELESLKEEIKKGLISVINDIHPRPKFIDTNKISNFSDFLYEVNDVYTTNYDIISYYSILENKEYNDYFFDRFNMRFTKFNKNDEIGNKHIYYLHGALFIFQDKENTLKIKKATTHQYLIKAIEEQLEANKYPLFISEGSSKKKLEFIKLNPYLNFCFESLQNNSSENMIVFGSSFSEQDEHITNAIDNSYKKIAISIKFTDDNKYLEKEFYRISSQFKNAQIIFYRADSLFI